MTIGTSFEARRYTVPILDNNKGVIIIIELNELKQIFKYRKKQEQYKDIVHPSVKTEDKGAYCRLYNDTYARIKPCI